MTTIVSELKLKKEEKRNHTEELTKSIIHRIRNGDKRAFSELVRLYHNQVAALAYKTVGDYDMAADITQNVFIKTNRNIWRYDENKKFYTWLYRITVNASIDYKRKHNRHNHEPIENIRNQANDKFETPDASFKRNQIRRYISEATSTLNDKQRSAFILRDVDGCQINDVANIMDIPAATVRWYLHRARDKIKKELLRKCPHLVLAAGFK